MALEQDIEELRRSGEQDDRPAVLEGNEEQYVDVHVDVLSRLANRLTELEQLVEQIDRQNNEEIERLEQEINTIRQKQTELETETKILHSRSDHISDFTDDLESQLDRVRNNVKSTTEELDRRITLLEENGSQAANESTTETNRLSRLDKLDDETIEEEFSVDVRRAIEIYRNFKEWSSVTTAGSRIKSGELRKLLNAKTDESLAWTQVYRAMNAFEENTPEEYELVETKTIGKALIKRA